MKPFIINRSVDFSDVDAPYITLELGGAVDHRPYFLGMLPISYLPKEPTEKDANDLLGALKNPANASVLFDLITKASPDPRMNQSIHRMVAGALLNDYVPSASDIVANAGFDTDGQFMDADKIITDIGTLIVALQIPRTRDDATFLKDNEANWRFDVRGTSSFFGRRWNCEPSAVSDNADFQLRYYSEDDSWVGPWKLLITAVYP
jgi:hypothetical protein